MVDHNLNPFMEMVR